MHTQLDLLKVVDVEFDHFGYLSDRLEFAFWGLLVSKMFVY